MTRTITLSAASWTQTTASVFYDDVSKSFYADSTLTTEIVSINKPVRETYGFNGYYSANSATDPGDQYIDADGSFTAAFYQLGYTLTGNKTIYIGATKLSYKCVLSVNGGTANTGTSNLFYRISGGGWFYDDQCTVSADRILRPNRASYGYRGHFSASNGGTQYFDDKGLFLAAFNELALTADKTIYALWTAGVKIAISANSGTGGYTEFYFNKVDSTFHHTNDFDTSAITSIEMHTREFYGSLGYRATNSDTGDIRVNADGTIVDGWLPTANVTIYARWTARLSWPITINYSGVKSGLWRTIYAKVSTTPPELFEDDLCTVALSDPFVLPDAPGFPCDGVYDTAAKANQYFTAEGERTAALDALSITAAKTWYAPMTANIYTLTLDYNGGSGSVSSKQIVSGMPIGDLPEGTFTGMTFGGWLIDGDVITPLDRYNYGADKTATAQWLGNFSFGRVTDYFGLGDRNLVPVSSDPRDTRKFVSPINAGRSTNGVNELGGVLRSPTVTYEVVNDCDIKVRLGKAFAAKWVNGKMVTSGYMITAVTVETSLGNPPRVTIESAANEGANAINTWDIVIPVTKRHRAQNLLGCLDLTAGYDLHSLSMRAAADAVVLDENLMPCASDIVRGRFEATYQQAVYDVTGGTIQAANGFTLIADPISGNGTGYSSANGSLRKDMV